ncbi:thiamine pyrophosphate protein [Candidatus Moduliflexus flocculans]|uniref:Thiamine pyrophosphate protein n=1 Tax=Candidatus Moduliflexus flocculans TaxID=1499966 RepID=A0A0S6VXE3_9BACT|nr:thiamine pyrophosphate protein [Candidatus Moduliflexus flocculans]
MAAKDYIRQRFFPHLWCAGCGHGIILNALLRAIDDLGWQKNELVMVSGIGCSSRITGYVDFHSLHTLHGRALAFATGVKLSRPELKVIVAMGDGDALAIGGNHFIHAARRNIEMTAIVMNNRIYGMTGGQHSPLSGCGVIATTAPYANIDREFDVVELSKAAGATFIARATTYHVQQMTDLLKQALTHPGFSVVEALSQCPTYFGRKNKLGGAVEMMEWYKTHTTPIGSKAKQEDPTLIERGVFVQEERPEYCREYDKMVAKLHG